MAKKKTDWNRAYKVEWAKQHGMVVEQMIKPGDTGYYFAYGANLNIGDMAWRCEDAEPLCKAWIPDWRMTFKGCCDIEPHEGATCHGGLWRISARDEHDLDGFEGFPYFYRKEKINVHTQHGVFEAIAYIMNADERDEYSMPSEGYVTTVLGGYKDFDLPIPALNESYQRIKEKAGSRVLIPLGYKRLAPIDVPASTMNATKEDWENGLVEDLRVPTDDDLYGPSFCEACDSDMEDMDECWLCGWRRSEDPFAGTTASESILPSERMLRDLERSEQTNTHDTPKARGQAKLDALRVRAGKRGNGRHHSRIVRVVEGVNEDGDAFVTYNGEDGMLAMAKAFVEGSQ